MEPLSTLNLIDSLSSSTKRLDKEHILLDAFMRGNREFFIGAKYCFDPFISFGVDKVAEIIEADDSAGNFSFSNFISLIENLKNQRISNPKAAIDAAAEISHVDTWNKFYRRILLKDIQFVNPTLINKVLNKLTSSEEDASKLLIPTFGYQKSKPQVGKIIGKKLVDLKLKGKRIITLLDKESGKVTQYTKNGKIITEYQEICESLRKILREIPGSIVLDGQVVNGSFQEIMNSVESKESKLALFDIIPLSDYMKGFCNILQRDRHAVLATLETSGLLQKFKDIYVLPKIEFDFEVDDTFKTFYKDISGKREIDGLMIKNPDSGYSFKPNGSWATKII